jgi:hypothetical protein
MNDFVAPPPADLSAAKPTWREDLVLVCRKCQKKSDGVDGKSLSKWLKRALKSEGQGKRFRIVQVDCLGLCPKHAVTLLRASDVGRSRKPLQVFREGEDPQRVVDWLLGVKPVES